MADGGTYELSDSSSWTWDGKAGSLRDLPVGDRVALAGQADGELLERLGRDRSEAVVEAVLERYGPDVPSDLLGKLLFHRSHGVVAKALDYATDHGRTVTVEDQLKIADKGKQHVLARWTSADPATLQELLAGADADAGSDDHQVIAEVLLRPDIGGELFAQYATRFHDDDLGWSHRNNLHPILLAALDRPLSEHSERDRDLIGQALAETAIRLSDAMTERPAYFRNHMQSEALLDLVIAACQSDAVALEQLSWRALTEGPERLACNGCLHSHAAGTRHDGVAAGAANAFALAGNPYDEVSLRAATYADEHGAASLEWANHDLALTVSPGGGLTISQRVAKKRDTIYTFLGQTVRCTCEAPQNRHQRLGRFRTWDESLDRGDDIIRFINWPLATPGLIQGAPCGTLALSADHVVVVPQGTNLAP